MGGTYRDIGLLRESVATFLGVSQSLVSHDPGVVDFLTT